MNSLDDVIETLLDIAATDREACAELANMGLIVADEGELSYVRLENCATFLSNLKEQYDLE